MSYTKIKSLHREPKTFLNKEVLVAGWVRTVRSSGDIAFMEINDGSFFKGLQVVFDNNLNNFAELEKIAISSSLEIAGTLIESPAAGQPFELKASKITILGTSDSDYPLQKKGHSPPAADIVASGPRRGEKPRPDRLYGEDEPSADARPAQRDSGRVGQAAEGRSVRHTRPRTPQHTCQHRRTAGRGYRQHRGDHRNPEQRRHPRARTPAGDIHGNAARPDRFRRATHHLRRRPRKRRPRHDQVSRKRLQPHLQ